MTRPEETQPTDRDAAPDRQDEPESPLLAAARAAYASRPVPLPTPDLIDRAVATLGPARPSRRLPLPAIDGVRAFVTDTAAALALRRAVDDEPAVVARRCRIEAPGRDDTTWRVELTVSIRWPHYDRDSAAAVRRRVAEAAVRLFGVTVTTVDLHLIDVVSVDLIADEDAE